MTQEKMNLLKKEIKQLDIVSKNMSVLGHSRESNPKDAFDKSRAAKHMKRSKAVIIRNERKIEEKQSFIDNVEK